MPFIIPGSTLDRFRFLLVLRFHNRPSAGHGKGDRYTTLARAELKFFCFILRSLSVTVLRLSKAVYIGLTSVSFLKGDSSKLLLPRFKRHCFVFSSATGKFRLARVFVTALRETSLRFSAQTLIPIASYGVFSPLSILDQTRDVSIRSRLVPIRRLTKSVILLLNKLLFVWTLIIFSRKFWHFRPDTLTVPV